MKREKWSEKKINIVLGCLLLTFLVSLPLFTDFLLVGADLQFQLLRIEALRDGLKEAGSLLWSKPNWVDPKGFSFAFFYGDTFLYIPAFFRMMGINVQMSYRIFLVLINAATVFGSYVAFRKIFKDDYTGLLGSTLYSMSIYRVFLLYSEAELGEVLALIFLPFVLMGICMIFRSEDREQDSGWIWLSLGLVGMLRSHILSFGITVIFLIAFAVINCEKLKKAAVWKQIGLSVAAFLLLNINYFYSMLQYIRIGGFVVNPVSGVAIQDKGVQIVQLFMAFYQAGDGREFGANGVDSAAPVGLGIVFLVAIFVFCYFLFVYGEDFEREEKRKGVVALGTFCLLTRHTLLPVGFDLKMVRVYVFSGIHGTGTLAFSAGWAYSVYGIRMYYVPDDRKKIWGAVWQNIRVGIGRSRNFFIFLSDREFVVLFRFYQGEGRRRNLGTDCGGGRDRTASTGVRGTAFCG